MILLRKSVQTEFKHKASSIASSIASKNSSIPVLNFKYSSMDDFLTLCKNSLCLPYPERVRVMPRCIINLPVKVAFNKIELDYYSMLEYSNTRILCFMLYA